MAFFSHETSDIETKLNVTKKTQCPEEGCNITEHANENKGFQLATKCKMCHCI